MFASIASVEDMGALLSIPAACATSCTARDACLRSQVGDTIVAVKLPMALQRTISAPPPCALTGEMASTPAPHRTRSEPLDPSSAIGAGIARSVRRLQLERVVIATAHVELLGWAGADWAYEVSTSHHTQCPLPLYALSALNAQHHTQCPHSLYALPVCTQHSMH